MNSHGHYDQTPGSPALTSPTDKSATATTTAAAQPAAAQSSAAQSSTAQYSAAQHADAANADTEKANSEHPAYPLIYDKKETTFVATAANIKEHRLFNVKIKNFDIKIPDTYPPLLRQRQLREALLSHLCNCQIFGESSNLTIIGELCLSPLQNATT
ncbi:hypothetical protein G7Y79_00016g040780 [Physcia stellaris]|nr:hypothetical protein G7Y79_00016g040780 [Physcia stellaris]